MVSDTALMDQDAPKEPQNRYEKAMAKMGPRDRWAGLHPNDARLKRALDKLSPKVLARLKTLAFQSEDQQVSLGACKEILDRALGKARQTVDKNSSIVLTADAHVKALIELSRQARDDQAARIGGPAIELEHHAIVDADQVTSSNDINGLDDTQR